MATKTLTQQRGHSRRAPLHLLLPLVLLSTVAGVTVPAEKSDALPAPTGGYNWPVRPFERPHPVRGNFADPRTTFDGPLTPRRLMHGDGAFEIHDGIDIAVPDGTPVYPVRSGTASLRNHEVVRVASGDSAFEYWHIVPAVRDGQPVTAYETVLGHVRRTYGHVHFTEYVGAVRVNPLARGHLRPYSDRTRPAVRSVAFRSAGTSASVLPEFVRGRVTVLADAFDMPSRRVPGEWRDLPVAPATVSWRVRDARTRRVVVPARTAFDAGGRYPRAPFWDTYARGTRQNMTGMGPRGRAWLQPGVYLFNLGTLDTERLRDGVYELLVTAKDTRGNAGSLRQLFSVRNAGRWLRG